MLLRPRFIPISIAVLKTYGKRASIVYGYCLSLGCLISEHYPQDKDAAAFMGIRASLFKLAKRKLVKHGVIDTDYTVLKPPTEPYTTAGSYYLPGIIFVPGEIINQMGFFPSLAFSFVCQATALTGGVKMPPQFWAWVFDKPIAHTRVYLYKPVWYGLAKAVRGEDGITRLVPTEKGWKKWIWGDNTAAYLLSPGKHTDISRQ